MSFFSLFGVLKTYDSPERWRIIAVLPRANILKVRFGPKIKYYNIDIIKERVLKGEISYETREQLKMKHVHGQCERAKYTI